LASLAELNLEGCWSLTALPESLRAMLLRLNVTL
jgi:hypothetical protein